MPAESDFSIRPGWFYHADEDDKVKTARQLLDHYFVTVGLGGSMLLNIPPDKRGLINEKDKTSLAEFGKILDQLFAVNYAKGATVVASNTRGNSEEFAGKNVLDDDRYSYWSTDDGVTTGDLVLTLKGKRTFNVIRLRENIKLGQRIDDWAVDIWVANQWKQYAAGSAIGSCRLIRGNYVTTNKVRIRITSAPVSPCLSEVGIFTEPVK
jgi:alpha-L-fucosidase